MSNNLQKIQKLAAGIRASLASLKTSNNLDDLDRLARERAILREKLSMLSEAEQDERERLKAAEAESRRKARAEALHAVVVSADSAIAKHQQLTDKAHKLITDLVGVLVAREDALSRASFGLDDSVRQHITPEDYSALLRTHEVVSMGITPREFTLSWRTAILDATGREDINPNFTIRALRERLAALVAPPPSMPPGAPLFGLSSPGADLAQTARNLAKVEPDEAIEEYPEPVASAPAGIHQIVDLRG